MPPFIMSSLSLPLLPHSPPAILWQAEMGIFGKTKKKKFITQKSTFFHEQTLVSTTPCFPLGSEFFWKTDACFRLEEIQYCFPDSFKGLPILLATVALPYILPTSSVAPFRCSHNFVYQTLYHHAKFTPQEHTATSLIMKGYTHRATAVLRL